MKKRIWELDALRGLCLIGVILIHLAYDLVYLFAIMTPAQIPWLDFGQDWGGVIFLVLSGVCVTIGSKNIKRGLTVFACGMVITAVTAGMYWLHMADRGIIIYFGVLHCLGLCMLLWELFRKCPTWLLAALGATMVVLGLFVVRPLWADHGWFTVIGIPKRGFVTSDYFPLLPNLGYFLLGAAFGRTFYSSRQSLLPRVNAENPVIRFFCFLGRNSLLIYLVHQPVIAGVIAGWMYLWG